MQNCLIVGIILVMMPVVIHWGSIFANENYWAGIGDYSNEYFLFSRNFPSWEIIILYVVVAMIGLVVVVKKLTEVMDKISSISL